MILSDYTHMPYVACDPKTFDDQVFLYFSEEDAKEAVRRFAGNQESTRAAKLEKNGFLAFYTNLFCDGSELYQDEPGNFPGSGSPAGGTGTKAGGGQTAARAGENRESRTSSDRPVLYAGTAKKTGWRNRSIKGIE